MVGLWWGAALGCRTHAYVRCHEEIGRCFEIPIIAIVQVWHSRHHQTQTVPLMGVRRPGVAQTEQQLAPKGNGPNMDPMDPQIPQLCHSAGVLARQIPPDSDCAHLWVFAGRARHNLSNNWLRREVVPAWVQRVLGILPNKETGSTVKNYQLLLPWSLPWSPWPHNIHKLAEAELMGGCAVSPALGLS